MTDLDTLRPEHEIDPANGIVYGYKSRRPIGSVNNRGYIQIALSGRHNKYAHRMIWEYVNGPIPKDMQINHINGDKTDNRIANLELVTPQQNIQHAYDHGLMSRIGEAHRSAKLTPKKVRDIRMMRAKGFTLPQIASVVGVAMRTVGDVTTHKTWKHVI